jgi:hypothetical protein
MTCVDAGDFVAGDRDMPASAIDIGLFTYPPIGGLMVVADHRQ